MTSAATTDVLADGLWYTRCPSPTASSIAIAGGWLDAAFEGTGIRLRSLADSPHRSVRQSHFTQSDHAQLRHGGIVPPLVAAARGVPITLLAISEVRRPQWVIALADSGLREPADLRGARIGLPRRTTEPVDFWRAQSLRGLTRALARTGLHEDDAVWVDLPTHEPYHSDDPRQPGGSLWGAREAARLQRPEVMALVRREVDAIYTYAPTGYQLLELLGARVVATVADGTGAGGSGSLSVLTAPSSLVQHHPDVVERFLSGLLRAAAWAASHPEECTRVLASEEGVPEEWVVRTWGGSALDLRPSLGVDLAEPLQAEADFLWSRGFLERPLRVSTWADARPLEKAARRVRSEHRVEER